LLFPFFISGSMGGVFKEFDFNLLAFGVIYVWLWNTKILN